MRFRLTGGIGSDIETRCRPSSLPEHPAPHNADDKPKTFTYPDRDERQDFECPWQEIGPVVVRFTSTSGRVALGNDFRTPTGMDEKMTPYWRYKGERGNAQFIRHWAAESYLTGPVGNTHVWFVERDNTLMVVGTSGSEDIDTAWDRLDKEALHSVSTELWWFAIVEADLVPEGATDSYDREFVFYDLPGGPGEYEFTFHQQKVFHAWNLSVGAKQEPPGELCWATLRKVGSN